MDPSAPENSWPGKPKLLERARDLWRAHDYRRRTEEVDLGWMRRFILFHGQRHPRELREPAVAEFLSHLTVQRAGVQTLGECESTERTSLHLVSFIKQARARVSRARARRSTSRSPTMTLLSFDFIVNAVRCRAWLATSLWLRKDAIQVNLEGLAAFGISGEILLILAKWLKAVLRRFEVVALPAEAEFRDESLVGIEQSKRESRLVALGNCDALKWQLAKMGE